MEREHQASRWVGIWSFWRKKRKWARRLVRKKTVRSQTALKATGEKFRFCSTWSWWNHCRHSHMRAMLWNFELIALVVFWDCKTFYIVLSLSLSLSEKVSHIGRVSICLLNKVKLQEHSIHDFNCIRSRLHLMFSTHVPSWKNPKHVPLKKLIYPLEKRSWLNYFPYSH